MDKQKSQKITAGKTLPKKQLKNADKPSEHEKILILFKYSIENRKNNAIMKLILFR